MKISIICGVYNAEAYLKRCIESLTCQTYTNLEIILVVNACKDGSAAIVREFEEKDKRIRAFYISEKLGAGGSRKSGFELATGDCVCFVDCDDMVDREYIFRMVRIMEGSPDTDIVFCNFKKVDAKGKELYTRKFHKKENALVQGIAPWGKMFRTDFLRCNDICFRNAPFGEDILFSSEIYLMEPKIALCDYVGYLWSDNIRSTSHTELRGFPRDSIEKAEEFYTYLEEKYPAKHGEINYFKYKYYIWYLLQSGRDTDKKVMFCEYKKAFTVIHKKENDCSRWKKIKGERWIVTCVLWGIRILDRMGLAGSFFSFYAHSFLGMFWPSL